MQGSGEEKQEARVMAENPAEKDIHIAWFNLSEGDIKFWSGLETEGDYSTATWSDDYNEAEPFFSAEEAVPHAEALRKHFPDRLILVGGRVPGEKEKN